LDEPEPARPMLQYGTETKLSWAGGLDELPAKRIEDWMREARIAHIDSRQYAAREGA
jgi:hypothetical protein